MRLGDRALAGLCFFVGAAQFLTAMMIGEAVWPDYNVGRNAISDLGTQNTAFLFNASVFVVGVLSVAGGYFLYRATRDKPLFGLLVLSGVGAMGVGLFPETTGAPHEIFALIAFVSGGLAAIVAYRVQEPPLRYISPVLGVLGLVALGLFISSNFLGLGFGGMERMIVYPTLLWEVAFGGYLLRPAPAAGQV